METPTAPTPPAEMNVFSRIVNVFLSPSETFNYLMTKPDWITPVIVMIILFLGSGILLKDIIQAEQIKAMRVQIMKSDRVPDNQKEQVIEQQTQMMKSFWAVGYVIGLVAILIMYFIGAVFLMVGGNNVLGGKATYIQVLSIFGYSLMIDILATLVKVPIMFVNSTMRVDTGLGLFAAADQTRSALYAFLSKFDLFTFWQLAVLVIGISMLFKFSKGKSAGLVFGLWLVWVLLGTGLTALGLNFG
ncbi:YIP1 family protein [bacterium]|nr:YIP1 family protein [bacterium]